VVLKGVLGNRGARVSHLVGALKAVTRLVLVVPVGFLVSACAEGEGASGGGGGGGVGGGGGGGGRGGGDELVLSHFMVGGVGDVRGEERGGGGGVGGVAGLDGCGGGSLMDAVCRLTGHEDAAVAAEAVRMSCVLYCNI